MSTTPKAARIPARTPLKIRTWTPTKPTTRMMGHGFIISARACARPPGVRVIVRAGRLVLGQIPAEELRDCLPRLVFSEPGQVGNLVDNGFYQALNTLVAHPLNRQKKADLSEEGSAW